MAGAVTMASGTRGRALTSTEKGEMNRAETEEQYRKLYGPHLEDVKLLQRRSFVVTKKGRSFVVDWKELDVETFKALADRERRLDAGARTPAQTVAGLKIGDTVPLTAKTSAARPTTTPAKAVITAKPAVASTPRPKAVEHSTELGKKPRVVWLDLGLLTVDRKYQRDLNEGGRRHINRILQAFNWNCYQPIIVTEGENGTYAVIDGQHRLEAAKRHPLIDSLPCYIIDAPDVAKQAAIFVEVNTNRKSLTSSEKFWAAHAAGDESATALAKICKDAGVTILRASPGVKVPPLALLGALVAQRLVAKLGPGPVREAIRLLAEVHSKTPGAFRSSTVSALTRIAADKNFVRDRLGAVLRKTDLNALHAEASTLAKGGGVGSLTAGTESLLRAALASPA